MTHYDQLAEILADMHDEERMETVARLVAEVVCLSRSPLHWRRQIKTVTVMAEGFMGRIEEATDRDADAT